MLNYPAQIRDFLLFIGAESKTVILTPLLVGLQGVFQ